MKSYSSRELLKLLLQDGWYIHSVRGSHHQLKHEYKKGRVTIPHPKKDLPSQTVKSIMKQAGISFL